MANRKRRSAAQKQRAKQRQQQRAQTSGDGQVTQGGSAQEGSTGTQTTKSPQRRPGDRPPRGSQRRTRSSRTSWILVGVVVVAVAVMVAVFATRDQGGGGTGATGSDGGIEKLTNVPPATLEAVGVPAQPSNVNALPADTAPVEQNGKPVVLYYGAEYCPFCAVERWPMVVALSRFGTFSGLESTTSAPPPETLPNTPTVTFHGSTYTSDYIDFSSVETETRDFQPLGTPTDFQQQLFDTYNVDAITGSKGAIPFVMIGNRYAWAGSQYDPQILQGKDFDQIATALWNPTSDIAQGVNGAANYITAMICQVTDNQPADVCSADFVQQAQSALP